MIQILKIFFLIYASLFIVACGGENTNQTNLKKETPQQEQKQETITAGDDQEVLVGQEVSIEASILDTNTSKLSYTWRENGKIVGRDEKLSAANLSVGKHTFEVEAVDENGKIYKDTITITIKEPDANNTPPYADDINITLDEDTYTKVAMRGGDKEGDPLSYLIVSYPKHGKLSGSYARLRYTPNANYHGKDSFTYKTNDGTIDSNIATVAIMISSVEDTPVANDINITLDEDTNSTISFSGSDNDGDPLSYKIITSPEHGTILEGNIYQPNSNYAGIDSLTYVANDGKSNSNEATVHITIKNINDTPKAFFKVTENNDTTYPTELNITLEEDSVSKEITIGSTDEDGDTLVYTQISPENGKVTGSVSDNDARLRYTPKANYYGTDSFSYYSKDSTSESNRVTVNITVTSVNDTPVAHDDINTTNEDTNITFNVLVNDTDVDNGDTLHLIEINATNGEGTVTKEDNGTVTFSPIGYFDSLKEGEEHNVTFTYKMADDYNATSEANVTITVIGQNDAPIANNYQQSINEDGNISINVLSAATDKDNNHTITIKSIQNLSNKGIVSKSDTNITYQTNGDFNYLGDTNETLIITYTIKDEYNATDEANITLTVIGKDTAPTAQDLSLISMDENQTSVSGEVNASDYESKDLDYSFVDTNTTFLRIDTDGKFYFEPDQDFYQSMPFGQKKTIPIKIKISDKSDNFTTVETNITIEGINNPPKAYFEVVSKTDSDVTLSAAKSYDVDGTISYAWYENQTKLSAGVSPTIALSAGEHNITLIVTDDYNLTSSVTHSITVDASAPIITPFDNISIDEDSAVISKEVNATKGTMPYRFSTTSLLDGFSLDTTNGSYSFDPSHATYQRLKEGSFAEQDLDITVTDALNKTDTKTLTIRVSGKNDTPIAHDDINTTNEDTNITFNVLVNDTDVDNEDTLHLIEINATNGEGTVTKEDNGTVTFSPNGDFDYLKADTNATTVLTYKIEDNYGATAKASVTITILGKNTAPTNIQVSDINLKEDTNSTIQSISYHDSDSNATFSISPESNASYFYLDANGSYSFKPTAGAYDYLSVGESETRTIMIDIKDGDFTIQKELNITIHGTNDAPVAYDDNTTTTQNGTVTIAVLENDTDADRNDTKTISTLSNPTRGVVLFSDDNKSIIFKTNEEFNALRSGEEANVTFTYTVKDSQNADSNRATVTVTVAGSDDDITASISANETIIEGESIELIANASTLDHDASFNYAWRVDGNGDSISSLNSFTIDNLALGEHTITCTVSEKTSNKSITISKIVTVKQYEIPFEHVKTIDSNINSKIIKMQLVDMDKDGDIDILATAENVVFWYENSENQSNDYTYHLIKESINTTTLKAADIDNDGYMDVVFGKGSVAICFNNKDKTFNCDREIRESGGFLDSGPLNELYSGFSRDDNINSLTVGDFYNDEAIDILVSSNEDGEGKLYYYNQDDTLFQSSPDKTYTASSISYFVDSADVNFDGKLDAVAVSSDGHVQYYKNSGSSLDLQSSPINNTTPTTLSIENINDAGELDIVATYSDKILWSSITDSTNFNGTVDLDIVNPPYAYGVDMDGDGDSDIVSNSYESNGQIVWYENRYDASKIPTFRKHIIANDKKNITMTLAADMDSDGDSDIVSSDDTGNIYIYKNNSPVNTFKIASPTGNDFTRDATAKTVRDNSSGLIWEDDVDVTKTWWEAKRYCKAKEGWRLPTPRELLTITDKSYNDNDVALVDTFQSRIANHYWTTKESDENNTFAWTVDFNKNTGIDIILNRAKSTEYNVRCVKGKILKSAFKQDRTNNATVIDTLHNLMWQDADLVQKNWTEAQTQCDLLDFGGYNDWRLPNINELYSIADRSKPKDKIAIYDEFRPFGITEEMDYNFWSSTSFTIPRDGEDTSLTVHFHYGDDRVRKRTNNFYVRCVRDIE